MNQCSQFRAYAVFLFSRNESITTTINQKLVWNSLIHSSQSNHIQTCARACVCARNCKRKTSNVSFFSLCSRRFFFFGCFFYHQITMLPPSGEIHSSRVCVSLASTQTVEPEGGETRRLPWNNCDVLQTDGSFPIPE